MPGTERRQLLAIALLIAATAVPNARADEAAQKFALNIPSQPLAKALQSFAQQSNLQVVYYANIDDARTANAVTGNLSTREALTRLLLNTDLTFEAVDENTVAIGPSRPAALRSSKPAGHEDSQSFWDRFRLADVDQGASATPPSVAPASAQVPESSDSLKLEEVVVTASKRQETLSKAPVAVTALSQQQLTDAGVESIANLTSVIPNMQFGSQGQFGFYFLTIRGIGNRNGTDDASPEVPESVDGVYIPDPAAINGSFYDLERVEVLRGPQGTLYGKNATAGTMNVITADPKNKFDASVDMSAGNYGDIETHAMLNIPLTDDLAIRGAVFEHRNDGYYNTNDVTARNYGAEDDRGGRLTILWRPLEDFKWRLSVEDNVLGGTPPFAVLTGPDGRPLYPGSPYNQPVVSTPEPSRDVNSFFVRSRLDWQINDRFLLTYLAGYSHFSMRLAMDGEAGETVQNSGFTETFIEFPQLKDNPYSQEVDLNYESGKWRNITGADYSHQHIHDTSYYYLPYIDLSTGTPMNLTFESWGIFDQATYSVTDRLRVTGGVRYSSDTDDWLNGTFQSFCPLNASFGGSGSNVPPGCSVTSLAGKGSWSKVTWKGGLDYDLSPNTLTYLTVASGYKAGGLNSLQGTFGKTYAPEDVTSYEIGAKTHLLDNTLSLNADLFYEKYTNLQETQQLATNIATQNAAAATIYGAELETQWRLSEYDRINGFLTYTHATFDTYNNAVEGEFGTIYPSLAGKFLPQAPEVTTKIQYLHNFAFTRGATLTPSVTVYWQSVNYLREFNLPIDRVPAYSKTDLMLTYKDSTGHWTAAGFVYNAEDHAIRNGQSAGGNYSSFYDAPRTFGVRIAYAYQ
jgi:iron complex outermembrane recepter protein